jgi:hypothetical protein
MRQSLLKIGVCEKRSQALSDRLLDVRPWDNGKGMALFPQSAVSP